MKAITTTLHFTSCYGKDVQLNVTRYSDGDLGVNWVDIAGTTYTAKQIRTANRESILLDYANQYVNIDSFLSEAIYENTNN